jgi:hypothetical protein
VTWTPLAADALPGALAAWLAGTPGVLRVAVDGPPCADPETFAAGLVAPLRELSRPAVVIVASGFWRDASLRLEYGREDVESYLSWLDAAALRREVLEPAVTTGHYLPSLRDPVSNRATREAPRGVEDGLVLLVSGSLLLRHGLPFDRTIHLALSSAARARRTLPEQAWTLPAYDAYDAEVRPVDTAGVAIKLDDPRHPALSWT